MMTADETTTKPPATFPTYREERAELECRMLGSDKVYLIQLTQSEAGWEVTAQYGPRGGTLTRTNPLKAAPYETAKKLFDSTIAAKLKGKEGKQYSHVDRGPVLCRDCEQTDTRNPSQICDECGREQVAPLTSSRGPVSTDVVFRPELLTRITEVEAIRYASNPRYFFQTKQDGDRLTAHNRAGNIFGSNKDGYPVRLDQQLHAAVSQLCSSFNIDKLLMDGEWEADGFHAWELLECRSDLHSFPYENRLETLETILTDLPPELAGILHLTYTARDTKAKLALLANRKLEGIAVKDRTAMFFPGRNGQHKKFKHEQFASFIVGPKPRLKLNDGKRSVGLYIIDPMAKWTSDWQLADCGSAYRDVPPVRFVATVGVPEKYPLPPIGAVIDVRYLYAYPGGGIAQDKYFGKIRTDVPHRDCTTAQLKFKARPEDDDEISG